MIAKGRGYISWEEITNMVPEDEILALYFDFPRLPFVMPSPFREDRNPSFECYAKEGRISFFDFSTREYYSLLSFLSAYWKVDTQAALETIANDIANINGSEKIKIDRQKQKWKRVDYTLKVKVREWRDYDIAYWNRFGIPIEWVKFANVYPISFQIREYDDKRIQIFKCDKWAYAFYEKKDGVEAFKIYQPYNNFGWKWNSNFRDGVISLWTQIPQQGKAVCICSSLKDALCLWSNTGIPSIAPQGEGYSLSNTVINDLKNRFKYVFVLFDIDAAGKRFSKNLCEKTGFINVTLPEQYGCKDISDLCSFFMPDKKTFRTEVLKSFKKAINGQ